jgi:5-methylcytosine-specific restriction endonuclease McrA
MGELRRQVYQREKGLCQMCGEFAPLDGHELERGHAHHVRYRSHGGPDESSNLIWLCPKDHDVVHNGAKPCPKKVRVQ